VVKFICVENGLGLTVTEFPKKLTWAGPQSSMNAKIFPGLTNVGGIDRGSFISGGGRVPLPIPNVAVWLNTGEDLIPVNTSVTVSPGFSEKENPGRIPNSKACTSTLEGPLDPFQTKSEEELPPLTVVVEFTMY
jgi:hypothetical protein